MGGYGKSTGDNSRRSDVPVMDPNGVVESGTQYLWLSGNPDMVAETLQSQKLGLQWSGQ